MSLSNCWSIVCMLLKFLEQDRQHRESSKMALAKTGSFLDDYLEYSSSLPAELQRILSTIRDLDERSEAMVIQSREMTEMCLNMLPQHTKTSPEQEEAVQKLRREIEVNHENTAILCTEKSSLAQQASDLIDQHIRRLDKDLHTFAEDLNSKQEEKIPRDQLANILPLPTSREEKKKGQLICDPSG